MMYHPIKLGYKKISSSADQVETVIFDQMTDEPSLWPWTWRKQTSLLAWHFGPWCCITIPSLLTEDSAAEEILSRWTFTGILNLFCDLDKDHNKEIQSFHKTIHLIVMYQQTKVSCKRICSWNFAVTLTLSTTIQFLCKTLWFMIMCHQTKFGSKRISSSKDTVEMEIFWSYELLQWSWPWK